jgi:hypothetical protein
MKSNGRPFEVRVLEQINTKTKAIEATQKEGNDVD